MAGLVGAVVPAAGQGTRLGSRIPKPFVRVAGRPLVVHALQVLQRSPVVDCIVVVAGERERPRMQALVRRYRLTKVAAVVVGGKTRSASVSQGIAALPEAVRWIVVHDGARPCLSRRLLAETVAAVKRKGAVVTGVPASVTVKAVDAKREVRLTLDREALWFIQTPQAFRRDWFMEATTLFNGAYDGLPDDAAILEWAGFPVHVIPGDPLNLKVTTKEDLALADTILRAQR